MAGNVLRVSIVDPLDASREGLRNTLLGTEAVWLEAECSRYDFFLDVIAQSPPDAVLVTLDAEPTRALQLVQSIATQYPDIDIIAASSRSDGQFILQAMRTGAKEFLAMPLQLDELSAVFERLRGGRQLASGNAGAKVIAFAGAHGGTGVTSIAVNLGCILAKNPENSVALVDLDLAMGDADVCLDIVANYTLADVAMNIDRIDLQLLKRSLSKHASGLYVLPHPVNIDDASLITEEHVVRVINLLKMSFTHILLDCSKSFNRIDFAALSIADEILLMTQLDVSSVRNVVRIFLAFSEREGMKEKVKVIATRVGSSENEIAPTRAEETIGRPIFYRVPNDSRSVLASRNSGIPLIEFAPRSKAYIAIAGLCEALTGTTADVGKPKKSGFFFFGGD